MKKFTLLAFLAMSCLAIAQAPDPGSSLSSKHSGQAQAPSYSDLYCAGFISNQGISLANVVAGGDNSPNETLYSTGDDIFLKGSGYSEGSRYSILRQLHDPNRYEPFRGQRAQIAALGQPWAQIGRVRIIAVRGPIAVAKVEFTCQNITLGDIAVPFQELATVSYRKGPAVERWPGGPGRVSGRIVMAREFDTQIGTGQKVYLSVGSNKGIKVGDYFRAVRGYDPRKIDPVDVTAQKAPPSDDTQKVPGRLNKATAAQLPLRNLGEMIVLNVTPTSATAMVTNAVETIQVGDAVELEGDGAGDASGQ
jgi:hypothetical protein